MADTNYKLRCYGNGTDSQVVFTDALSGRQSQKTSNGNSITFALPGGGHRLMYVEPSINRSLNGVGDYRRAFPACQSNSAGQNDVAFVIPWRATLSWNLPRLAAKGVEKVWIKVSGPGLPNEAMYGYGFSFQAPTSGFVSVQGGGTYTMSVSETDYTAEFDVSSYVGAVDNVDMVTSSVEYEYLFRKPATLKVTSNPTGAEVTVR